MLRTNSMGMCVCCFHHLSLAIFYGALAIVGMLDWIDSSRLILSSHANPCSYFKHISFPNLIIVKHGVNHDLERMNAD